jgi:putative DNA primase/helicase
MQATGLPGWAALSAVGIEWLILPAIVRQVVICADRDENGVGLRAAKKAAARWRAEGLLERI